MTNTTLHDLETHWGLDDVIRANAVLDIKEEIEHAMMPKIPSSVKGK